MKDVVIVGHGPTRLQCPWDADKEHWGVNSTMAYEGHKVDKLFIIDKITTAEFDYNKLAKMPCLVTSVPYPDHPEWNIEIFPLQEVLLKFRTTFFTNAICYMMAYALLKKYERIWFYGIDMMTNTTYLFEKGGVEYWMGICHALGVPVINTKESATGKTIDGRLYGYWGDAKAMGEYSRICLEEARRLLNSMKVGISGAVKVELPEDPDGHLARKYEAMRSGGVLTEQKVK